MGVKVTKYLPTKIHSAVGEGVGQLMVYSVSEKNAKKIRDEYN